MNFLQLLQFLTGYPTAFHSKLRSQPSRLLPDLLSILRSNTWLKRMCAHGRVSVRAFLAPLDQRRCYTLVRLNLPLNRFRVSKDILAQQPRANRPRSSTASSGAETPPLLTCDVSSASSGSQHSIDVGQLNELLNKVSHPGIDGSRTVNVRARPPGSGHRRRFSQILASRTSIYETIEEESTILSSPQTFEIPTPPSTKGKVQVQPKASPPREPVIVVDPASGEAYQECWDAETGLVTMRRYSALREEAQETVIESKRVWHDTAFSVSSLQCKLPLQIIINVR